MARYVALLRGINVGKHRQLPMAELREVAEELGLADVATHLRSGNLVFSADGGATGLGERLEAAIAQRFGFDVPVLVRSAQEIAAVLALDPLRSVAANDSRYHVVFLAQAPPSKDAAALAALDLAPDALTIAGREIYYWCPNGTVDSRAVTALGKSKLAVAGTDRNWNTVARLGEMLGA